MTVKAITITADDASNYILRGFFGAETGHTCPRFTQDQRSRTARVLD